jgi:hypothetical protein
MSWECLQCGLKNSKEVFECGKCSLDKEAATTILIRKKKTVCEECHHQHKEGLFCHVYTEAGDNEEEDEIGEPEDRSSSSSSSDEDEDDAGLGLGSRVKAAKKVVVKSLSTPSFIKKIGYIRCNCNVGVPMDSKRFVPVPQVLYCQEIQIQTYTEIADVSQRKFFFSNLQIRLSSLHEVRRQKNRPIFIANNMPLILSYLPLGACSSAPQVSSHWNNGTKMYQPYLDMRNCVPYQVTIVLRVYDSANAFFLISISFFSVFQTAGIPTTCESGRFHGISWE